MQFSKTVRTLLVAVAALAGATLSAYADTGSISIKIVKAGFIVGGSGGSGSLTFHGRTYPLTIGGLSAGLVFGAAETRLTGTVSHIHKPKDVEGVYAAAGAGASALRGASTIVLTNQKGATLALSGPQHGLLVNADLSGLAISLK